MITDSTNTLVEKESSDYCARTSMHKHRVSDENLFLPAC
jgi:hypothetical protein